MRIRARATFTPTLSSTSYWVPGFYLPPAFEKFSFTFAQFTTFHHAAM